MNLEIIARYPTGTSRSAPLLFIHGGYHGAWCWENFQDFFARHGYASHALNLRGHGASDGRERLRWTTARDYVEDIARAAEGLGRPPVLIGHSMGGYLVQKYLERRPAAGSVLLASMPSRGGIRIFNRMLRQRPLRTMNMHLTMRPYLQVETPALARTYLFSPDMPEGLVRRYHGRLQCESYRIGWDMSLFDVPRPGRVGRAPMLFLGAQKDTLILPGEIAETASAYGERAEFFDMAHDMMLDTGWEHVAQRVHEWLASSGV